MKRGRVAWFVCAVFLTVSQPALVWNGATKANDGTEASSGQQESSRKPACGCYVCGQLISVEFPDKAKDCAGILAEDACVKHLGAMSKEKRAAFCQKVKEQGKFTSFKTSCAGYAAVCEDGAPSPTGERSLYERLGGSETLGKLFDDVGARMAADPLLAKFFQGPPNALMQQRQRTIDFLCYASGGPCEYKGQSLKEAHGSLKINEEQWKAFVKHLSAALDHLKVATEEKRDVLALVARYKQDVVSKK